RFERDQPVVELLTADPERMLWRLVRAGDEPIDRHRDVQLQLAPPSADMLVGPPTASEVIGQARIPSTLVSGRNGTLPSRLRQPLVRVSTLGSQWGGGWWPPAPARGTSPFPRR